MNALLGNKELKATKWLCPINFFCWKMFKMANQKSTAQQMRKLRFHQRN